MQIVVDANPVVSILISPGRPINLFFVEELDIIAPELLFREIERNKDDILRKSGLGEDEMRRFLDILKGRIRVIPEKEFIGCREKAVSICPDEKDVAYFALALHVRCPLWSNEKKLKEQKDVAVFSTHELIALFDFAQERT